MNPAVENAGPKSGADEIVRQPIRRSLVNESVAKARQVFDLLNIFTPPFASWSTDDWDRTGTETREIRDCMLGWDVTDFGSGQFHDIGRTLFTLRNGRSKDKNYPKSYAEKLLLEPEGQRAPVHYHRSKREDIINRGGGNVIVVLHPIAPGGIPGDRPLDIQVDGISRRFEAGEPIRLKPGESVTIPPGTFHQFWGEEGTGLLLDGVRYTVSSEVSSVCDDWNDNVFLDSWALRFRPFEEDAAPTCYLCHEYPALAA